MGEILRGLMKIYNPNPVWIIKKALVALKVIGSTACTNVTEPADEGANLLAEFVAQHAVE